MMRRLTMLLLVLASIATVAYAAVAGSMVTTVTQPDSATLKVSIAWTSSAGGAVTENLTQGLRGRLFQVKFVPGSGAATPDAGYDVTMLDANGVDVAIGGGADLSATASTIVQVVPSVYLDGQTLQPVVANAGATNSGTITLWVER